VETEIAEKIVAGSPPRTDRRSGFSSARLIHAPHDQRGGVMTQSGWLSKERIENGSVNCRVQTALR